MTFNKNNPYVIPLQYALENLLQKGYNSFLLTIGCTTVSVYTDSNGLLKLFDSHARNSFVMVDPSGTCVLLEVNTVINLVEYFNILHRANVLFEMRGVHTLLCIQIVYQHHVILHSKHAMNIQMWLVTQLSFRNVLQYIIIHSVFHKSCHAYSGRILHLLLSWSMVYF